MLFLGEFHFVSDLCGKAEWGQFFQWGQFFLAGSMPCKAASRLILRELKLNATSQNSISGLKSVKGSVFRT